MLISNTESVGIPSISPKVSYYLMGDFFPKYSNSEVEKIRDCLV